jgi:hypothetical protein
MIRGYVAIAKIMCRGWMCCSADPSETELAAHQPPASLERLGPQAFYSSFSQWPSSQVMPDHS